MMRTYLLVMIAFAGCAEDSTQEPASCNASPGVGQPSEFLELRVRFQQPALAGLRTELITYDVNDATRVYAHGETRVASDGGMEQAWPDAYRRFEYQPIVYYIDVNDDGACTPGTDLGERFISTAWNPVGDAPLETDLALFPIPAVSAETCSDIGRCHP